MQMTFRKIDPECFEVHRGGRYFGALILLNASSMNWALHVREPQFYAGRYLLSGSYEIVIDDIKKHFSSSVR